MHQSTCAYFFETNGNLRQHVKTIRAVQTVMEGTFDDGSEKVSNDLVSDMQKQVGSLMESLNKGHLVR